MSDKTFKSETGGKHYYPSKKEIVKPTIVKENNGLYNWSYWTIDHLGKHVDPDSSWGILRLKVFSRDDHKCLDCGSRTNLTVQHKVALSLGGSNKTDNLITLCAKCHEKADKKIIFTAKKDFGDFSNYGDQDILTDRVDQISEQIYLNETIEIEYTDDKGTKTVRRITPKRLFLVDEKAYLRAYCDLRKADRTFKIARIIIR
ncbi:MAG: WYL domain-containing protein [Candidatus Saccharibacteria bacterium]|nr:WYL domain-containing protein [Candidatus Saccharibacteria bacterium]